MRPRVDPSLLPYLDQVVSPDEAYVYGDAEASCLTQYDPRTGIVYTPFCDSAAVTYEEIDWLGLGPEEE